MNKNQIKTLLNKIEVKINQFLKRFKMPILSPTMKN